jgi:FlaA1/EpsC-like NDP-sugar epimerase
VRENGRGRAPRSSLSRPASGRLMAAAGRVRGDLPLALLDAVFAVAAYGAVLTLRFDAVVPPEYWSQFKIAAPILVGTVLLVNWLWGLYGPIWRHASIHEARRILLASATVATILTVVMTVGPRLLPLSVVIPGTGLSTLLSGSMRFQSRLFALYRRGDERSGLRVIVLGAGESGSMLVRDMVRSPRAGLVPVALLDDDPRTHGRSSVGVKVVGAFDDLPSVANAYDAHHAVLAVAGASSDLVRRAADLADEAGIPIRVLPELDQIVGGVVTVHDLRELSIEDLLGREQVATDLRAVRELLAGQRVLITGAGGSIGSEIARQVWSCEPAALLLLDHDETHLHELCASLPPNDDRVQQLLVDIRDRDVLTRTFREHRPQIIFHAAAHKHVPLLEQHPSEAVRTNVLGTQHVVAAAASVGVRRLVFISTDKAVHPSSVMGASKRIAEDVVLTRGAPGAHYCAVRFGNVLGSRGSVIPTFLRQIEAGGPVTITDPRMTRFFMSIPEAVQLVLQAATMATGGEVFILEMGKPVSILDLAQRMIRLAGRRVGSDIEIRVTGVRPGEKLFEELHTPDEILLPTAHPSVLHIRPSPTGREELDRAIVHLLALSDQGEDEAVRHAVLHLAGAGRPGVKRDAPAQQRRSASLQPFVRHISTESTIWIPSNT